MRLYCLERELWVPRPLDDVFSFFSRPENLQTITPPKLNFRMVESPPILAAEALIRYSMRWQWMPVQWTSQIKVWSPPHRFVDRQISGPYALWNHEHSFSLSPGGTMVRDFVTYALPFGVVGRFAHALFVRREIESIFDFRAKTMQQRFAVAT